MGGGDAGGVICGVLWAEPSGVLLDTIVTSGGGGSAEAGVKLACRLRYRPRAREAANSLVVDAVVAILATVVGVDDDGDWLPPVTIESQSFPRSKPSLQ